MRTPPHGPARTAALALLLSLGAFACTTNRRTDLDASPLDLGTEVGSLDAADSDGAGTTCQGIRICIAAGQSLDVCVGRGTPAAQDTFNKLLGCLMQKPAPGCTGSDMGCICPEECYADGYCLDETAACLETSGATADGVCMSYCIP